MNTTTTKIAGEAMTDAEIKRIYLEQTGFDLDASDAAILDFARALLASKAAVPVEFDAWATQYGFHAELIDVHQYAKEAARDAWKAGYTTGYLDGGVDGAETAALERKHFGDPDQRTGIYTAPAQSCGEPCSHDYVRSDKVCTECGELVQTDVDRKALAAQSCGDAEQADEAVSVGKSGVSLLTDDHKGMRVDYSGLFKQATASLARGAREPALAEMLRQLKDHITEIGTRWYAGDTAVVDEILQLYCVEKDARATLAARAKDSK